jgi:hypothetical protein
MSGRPLRSMYLTLFSPKSLFLRIERLLQTVKLCTQNITLSVYRGSSYFEPLEREFGYNIVYRSMFNRHFLISIKYDSL